MFCYCIYYGLWSINLNIINISLLKIFIIKELLISVIVTNFIEMTTTFHITLRPILILSKSIGLIDITYTVEPSGLLAHNKNSAFHAVLEITRMIVLLICTFLYFHQFDPEVHILQIINTIKFWIIIIAARLSTKRIIKYILTIS